MPVNSCSDNGKPGYKWGDAGKCYTYTPGSEASKASAKKKALAQGIAIGDIELERLNEVTTGSMGSGIKKPQQGYKKPKKIKKAGVVIEEEAALANALIAIAEKYGKFNEDGSGVWAGYESPDENDESEIGVKCENCILYAGNGVCKIIDRSVEPEGKCRFAVIPDGVVNMTEEDNEETKYDFLNEFLLEEEVKSYEEFIDLMSEDENIEAIALSILEKELEVNMPMDDEEEDEEEEDEDEMEDNEHPNLNDRQKAQYEYYEDLVEEYGIFDQSIGANGAHYAPAEKNPFKEEGMICANCVFYEGGGGCEIVSGQIEPNAICKLWIIPENLLLSSSEGVEKVTYGRPGPNDPRKTPAKPSERRRGSRKNPKGSASSGGSVTFSEAVTSSLKTKMENHNKKTDASSKKATMGALKAVYRRGAGAFSTSHRPGMTRGQWAMARVNAYLYLLRNGRPSNPNYTTDNDLLPKGHPRSSK